VGIVQDITERKKVEEALKESEGKYRLLVNNANESILIIQGGVIKFANPRLYRIMGYPPEEDRGGSEKTSR